MVTRVRIKEFLWNIHEILKKNLKIYFQLFLSPWNAHMLNLRFIIKIDWLLGNNKTNQYFLSYGQCTSLHKPDTWRKQSGKQLNQQKIFVPKRAYNYNLWERSWLCQLQHRGSLQGYEFTYLLNVQSSVLFHSSCIFWVQDSTTYSKRLCCVLYTWNILLTLNHDEASFFIVRTSFVFSTGDSVLNTATDWLYHITDSYISSLSLAVSPIRENSCAVSGTVSVP